MNSPYPGNSLRIAHRGQSLLRFTEASQHGFHGHSTHGSQHTRRGVGRVVLAGDDQRVRTRSADGEREGDDDCTVDLHEPDRVPRGVDCTVVAVRFS